RDCARRSVDVSTRMDLTASASGGLDSVGRSSIAMDGRVRRSRGSVERQTLQSQPIDGTPCDVPLPRTVTLRFNNALPAAGSFDESEPQLVEDLLEDLPLFSGQVAARLLIQEAQDLDHLGGAVEIHLGRLTRDRIRQVAEVDRSCARQRQDERRE